MEPKQRGGEQQQHQQNHQGQFSLSFPLFVPWARRSRRNRRGRRHSCVIFSLRQRGEIWNELQGRERERERGREREIEPCGRRQPSLLFRTRDDELMRDRNNSERFDAPASNGRRAHGGAHGGLHRAGRGDGDGGWRESEKARRMSCLSLFFLFCFRL